MLTSIGEDPSHSEHQEPNPATQPDETERADEIKSPSAEAPASTRPNVEAEQSPRRRRSFLAHLLDRGLDWLQDWLLHQQGFSEAETEVILHQLQAHHQTLEAEQWQLRKFALVEIYERKVNNSWQQKTIAYSGDQDRSQEWEGIARLQIAEWLLNKLSTGDSSDSQADPERPKPPTRLTILQAQIRQPSQTEVTVETQEENAAFTAPIRGREPFDVDIRFQVEGLAAAELPLTYDILYDAKDETTNQKVFPGGEKQLPTQLIKLHDSYTATLKGLQLPPGTYKLRLVISDHARLMTGISPVLQVI